MTKGRARDHKEERAAPTMRTWRPKTNRCPSGRAPPIEQFIKPRETRRRAMRRPIFTTDPAVVSQIVEQPKQILVIDFADIGLVPARHACNLDVPDVRQPSPDLLRQV